MGQTLTHGIYLPDEGERNCYNGLAANWSILDGAVGTIAEHTSALSGKAPLVHTHTKSDITDFPAYGNTAGTICEGNDSRLSDARTPVAHTHGKADITDLFNSENTWTANNTFTGTNSFSQYQILQAGAYFYNSDSTATTSGLNLRNSKVTKGGTSDSGSQIIQFLDKDNKFLSQVTTAKALSGTTQLQFTLGNIDRNNNSITGGIVFSLAKDGTKQFIPSSDSTHNLGNSSYKWKTLNGINPGALSLPKGYTEEGADKDYIDITSVIQTLDGTLYNYTMPDNGWICVRAEQAQHLQVTIQSWSFGQSISHPTGSTLIVSVPFRKNDQISLKVKAVTLQYARFYPMQGNV